MTSEQLKARTKRFALEVIALVSKLPRTLVCEIIGRQLVRSFDIGWRELPGGLSGAVSGGVFGKGGGGVWEEADERLYWLEITSRLWNPSGQVGATTQPLIAEAAEFGRQPSPRVTKQQK